MNETPAGNSYVVHVVNFPGSVRGAVATTGDDVYHIFLNDCLTPEQRREALEHEIRHIDGEHLYNDILPVNHLEQLAKGQRGKLCDLAELGKPLVLNPEPRRIPFYHSLRQFRDYVYSLRPRNEGGPADPKTDEPVREDGKVI